MLGPGERERNVRNPKLSCLNLKLRPTLKKEGNQMWKKTWYLLMLLPVLMACTTTVQLSLHNLSSLDQSAIARTRHRGVPTQEIALGELKPNGDLSQTFKVKHDHELVVNTLASGYIAWESSPETVLSKPDPKIVKLDVKPTPRVLDEAAGVRTIMDQFTRIGRDYGILPYKAQQAADHYLGALLLVIPPSENGQEGKELFRVPPSQFLGTTMPQQINYQDTSSVHTAEISGTKAAELSAAIPLLKTGTTFKDNTLYQFSWSMTGYGNVLVKEPENWSPFHALQQLPEEAKRALHEQEKRNPDAVLLYVSRLYAIRDGRISTKEGRKLDFGSRLDASSVLGLGGAWTFESNVSSENAFKDVVLNIGGEVIQAELIEIAIGAKSEEKASTSLGAPLFGEDVMFSTKASEGRKILKQLSIQPMREPSVLIIPEHVRRTGVYVTFTPQMLKED